jgi:hypothetical protein
MLDRDKRTDQGTSDTANVLMSVLRSLLNYHPSRSSVGEGGKKVSLPQALSSSAFALPQEKRIDTSGRFFLIQ